MSVSTPADAHEHPEPSNAPGSPNILLVIWRRKSLLILGMVVGLVVGVLYYMQCPAVYQASSQIYLTKKRSDAVPITGNDPRVSYYEDYLSTHLLLIKSPVILERAVKKHDLASLPTFADSPDPVGALAGGLSASRDSREGAGAGSNIMNLSFRGPVASDCPVVLNAVIASYREFLGESYRSFNDEFLKQINDARDQVDTVLQQLQKDYRAFREKSPLMWKGRDGITIHQARMVEIESRRSTLLVRRAELEGQLAALETAKKNGTVTVVSLKPTTGTGDKLVDPVADLESQLDEQLFPLLVQEQTLLEDFGADYPQVRAVRKRIEMVREHFKEKMASLQTKTPGTEPRKPMDPVELRILTARQELGDIDITLNSLARLLESETKEARQMNTYEIEDERFRSEISRRQQIYDQIIRRLQEMNLVREFGGFDAQLISPPGIGGKVAPSSTQTLFAGAVLGMLVGMGLAYLAELADSSFRTPEEIRRRLGLPLIGHIPYLAQRDTAKGPAVNGSGLPLSTTLSTYFYPKSAQAEAYRSLRTALYFSTHGEGHKVIQVTSPNMGDGKTTVSTNIAVCIAQSGKRVVLIDADFRRPRVHAVFGLKPDVGLASVINGDAELTEAAHDSGIPNLTIMPCGPRPTNPAELLTSPQFAELLEVIRNQYDFVIVDTPPLLAVTDPCVVAPRVDGVLLTIRVCKNGRPAAVRAREVLNTLGASVLGVVVNGVGEVGGYEHYYYDDYKYEYAPTDGDGDEPPHGLNGHADGSLNGHGEESGRPRRGKRTRKAVSAPSGRSRGFFRGLLNW